MLPNTPTLSLKALTWVRDTHGLFDYETLELNKNTLEIRGNCKLVRYGHEVALLDQTNVSKSLELLADIRLQDGTHRQTVGCFYVTNCKERECKSKLWLIVNNSSSHQLKRMLHDLNPEREIVLTQGTVFKLGRVTLRVKNLRFATAEYLHNTSNENTDTLETSPQ